MATITIQIPIKLDALPGACYSAEWWLNFFRSSDSVPEWYKAGEAQLVVGEHEYSPDLMTYMAEDPNEWTDRCRVCLQTPTPEHNNRLAQVVASDSVISDGMTHLPPAGADSLSTVCAVDPDPKPTLDGELEVTAFCD